MNSQESLVTSESNALEAFSLNGRAGKQIIKPHLFLKQLVWLYFFLLIFEGALRKWFLPQLAAPLLIIRDPVALLLIAGALREGILRANFYLSLIVAIGFISFFTALFIGHGNLPVALFGTRILLLQFPLIFVVGKVFNKEDVLKMGKTILWICLPMTLLLALQFYSPQAAWVNRGLGGEIVQKGFQGALGHFRPPGTFSFVTGTYLFYGLATCFVVYFWIVKGNVNNFLLISSTICVIASIPLSISRTLFFEICLTLLFAFIAVLQKPKYLRRMVFTLIVALTALVILSNIGIFEHATDAFTTRFTDASKSEGGVKGTLGNRFFGNMIDAITNILALPFFGYGTGLGTNVGSQLIAGSRGFLVHEDEWGRVMDELGPLLGLGLIFLRIGLSIKLARACYKSLRLEDILPWLLLSFGFLSIIQGNWAQPTSLGFCILIGGLIIASLKRKIHHQKITSGN